MAELSSSASIGDDPYHVGGNEQTGIAIVSKALIGAENFVTWKRAMEIALSARSKLGFVLGKYPKPEDPNLQIKWQRCNDLVMSWIVCSVTEPVINEIIHAEDVMTTWDILQASYGGTNLARRSNLKRELSNLVQGEMSVTEYHQKMSSLWQELDSMRSQKCLVGKNCPCCKNAELERTEDRINQFLIGLNDCYASVRSQVNAMTEVPKFSVVYGLVLQEEASRKMSKHTSVEQSALFSSKDSLTSDNIPVNNQFRQGNYSRRSGGRNKNQMQRPYCTYCQMQGHTREQCYKLVGYPRDTHNQRYPRGNRSRPLTSAHCVVNNEGAEKENNEGAFTDSQMEQLKALIKKGIQEKPDIFTHMAGMVQSTESKVDKNVWLLDSGATNHFTYNIDLLRDITRLAEICLVKMPDGNTVSVEFKGNANLGDGMTLKNVLFVPEFSVNLISVSRLTSDSNCQVVFTENGYIIQDAMQRKTLRIGDTSGGLFRINSVEKTDGGNVAYNLKKVDGSFEVWHQRLGHPSSDVLAQLLKNTQHIIDCKGLKYECEVCPLAKQTKLSFSLSKHNTKQPFELLHMDVWGPSQEVTLNGARYFLTIVDDYTRTVWTYLIAAKSDVSKIIIDFFKMVQTQFDKKIKILRSDNGGEFLNSALQMFLKDRGCLHQTTCPYTPQQNGVTERKHRHLLDVARSLLFQSGLPNKFWGDSILTATYVINRLPSKVLHWKSPWEMLFNKRPSIDNLKVFGCLCFASTNNNQRSKFDPRAVACIFLGYPVNQKGYKLFNMTTQKVIISRHVIFHEQKFPYKKMSEVTFPGKYTNTPVIDSDISMQQYSDEPEVEQMPGDNLIQQSIDLMSQSDVPLVPTSEELGTQSSNIPSKSESVQVRRSQRLRKSPGWKKDFLCTNGVKVTSPHSMDKFISYAKCSDEYIKYALQVSAIQEPTSFSQAKKDVRWMEAMEKEIQALEQNQTWQLTSLPHGKKLVDCKWVYKVKLLSDGSVERFKARLVAKGYTQEEGIDYKETFAPVVKMTSVRCLLAISAVKKWPIFQLDVNNAFLHGSLDEEVYMKLPPGFYQKDKLEGKVCKLQKSLYGLKQASRQWFSKFSDALLSFGFKKSMNDYSLFTLSQNGEFLILLVYVDDVLITGTSAVLINDVKQYIHDQFRIKDLGTLKFFLGLEVARSASGIFLHQRKYALDILKEHNMTDCKPMKTPMDINHKLSLSKASLMPEPLIYRKLVGKLIYLTITRPDLAFPVHVLSQFMQNPTIDHFQAAMRVLRFIKGAPAQGIFYSATSDLKLKAYCDADWASCPLTRKSVTGFCVTLGSSAISWKTRKQPVISRSSAESEYRAMAGVCCELVWVHRLLSDMGLSISLPISLYCDNKAAIHIAHNPVFHERTKHVELDCHWVRHHLSEGFIKPEHISTSSQAADIFTKATSHDQLNRLTLKLGVSNFLHSAA